MIVYKRYCPNVAQKITLSLENIDNSLFCRSLLRNESCQISTLVCQFLLVRLFLRSFANSSCVKYVNSCSEFQSFLLAFRASIVASLTKHLYLKMLNLYGILRKVSNTSQKFSLKVRQKLSCYLVQTESFCPECYCRHVIINMGTPANSILLKKVRKNIYKISVFFHRQFSHKIFLWARRNQL